MIRSAALTGVFVATLAPAALQAADPYDDVIRAEILPGWQTEDGTQMVGLKLELAPGWKTYWRAPGDAGIPPRFDWSGSENLSGAVLHWPQPQVFYQNEMRTIGYKSYVVLPIELTPADPAAPITVNGRVELGICLDICMPMALDLHASLPGTADPAPIHAALEALPVTADEAGVGTIDCKTEDIADGLRLTAVIDLPPRPGRELAVIELEDGSVWVSEAEMRREGGALTAVADLVPPQAAPFPLDPATVRITILSDGRAVDIDGCSD